MSAVTAVSRRIALALAALFCALTPIANAALAQEPEERASKVLLIGLDGVRVDILAEAETPNIDPAWDLDGRAVP